LALNKQTIIEKILEKNSGIIAETEDTLEILPAVMKSTLKLVKTQGK